MVLGVTKTCSSISLILAIFHILTFIGFGTRVLFTNEVHRASFKWFQLNNILIQSKQNKIQFHSGIFIVCD